MDDRYTDLNSTLYVFVIIISDKKEYVHSLKNFSKNSHTGEFLCNEISQVLNNVSSEKFCAIVSDHAANIILAKKLIADQYPYILPMHCIAHHINLLTNDIMKLNWTSKIIMECKKVVKFFKKSHTAGELLREKIAKNPVKGGGLKQYIITRWTISFDCADSIFRCQIGIQNVSKYLCIFN